VVERGTDALEDEALLRPLEGTLKPVYQGGKKAGTVREFSDTLLIFMLKAPRPRRLPTRWKHANSSATNLSTRAGFGGKVASNRSP
jgi:hypothetical protein